MYLYLIQRKMPAGTVWATLTDRTTKRQAEAVMRVHLMYHPCEQVRVVRVAR